MALKPAFAAVTDNSHWYDISAAAAVSVPTVILVGSPKEQIVWVVVFKLPPAKAGATVTVTTLLSVKHTLLFNVLIALLLKVVLTVSEGGS